MNKIKQTTIILLAAVAGAAIAQDQGGQAAPQTNPLDQLLQDVREAATEQDRINEQREQEFLRERNRRQQLLQEAREQLQAEQDRSERLQAEFDDNEQELAELSTTLEQRQGNLGELFGVVRQVAGDFATKIEDSMLSAQYPGRAEFLSDLAERSELPTGPELRKMWYEMVRQIAEQGKVVEFSAPIVNADGETVENQDIVRVGVFNAISDGRFLSWDSDEQELVVLPRQPAGRYQNMAGDLQQAQSGGVEPFGVDFTRGQILSQVVQTPTLRERIRQGAAVGRVIIALGIIGILFALWRGVVLFIKGNAIKRQLKREEPDENNALGRVMSVYTDNPDTDIETLELKLDEAIMRETAPLESGLSIIKVLYVVAPLMGLLGTVVGMIQTFQQITLFGTGDPRMMASGISMALITTVLGLTVAIPLTILHSLLQTRARSLIQILEEQAAGIVSSLAEQGHGRAK